MGFFDITFVDRFKELLPPKKRLLNWLAWINSLAAALQSVHSYFFIIYKTGSSAPVWDNATTFFKGVQVVYFDNGVYECLQTNSATVPNLYPDYWYKITDNYIGVDERLKYNSQIIIYEYALNKWFRNIGATNQIYVVNNVTYGTAFLLGNTGQYSSSLPNTYWFAANALGNTYTVSTPYDYTIKVPVALWNTLGSITNDKNNAVRNVAERYNMAGMTYNIITY